MGITPACAGKSVPDVISRSLPGDHPRMRGEKRLSRIERRNRRRITPACAGKRSSPFSLSRPLWDHPRMRGEKNCRTHSQKRTRGSPPHARGKVLQSVDDFLQGGITPACAGKRDRYILPPSLLWDHPRMRGEKQGPQLVGNPGGGSPPHARGKGEYDKSGVHSPRITPACAGKSLTRFWRFRKGRDHPRMRGEKYGCFSRTADYWGSPPHARGKATTCWPNRNPPRITPACAGKRTFFLPFS